jgi:CCR4-NOT transcription complex subunit 4
VKSNKFFGQYGKITRVLINSQTKDYYEQQGQCAVYIWYESTPSVALALKCLNGLKIGQGTLKCSFGTSKYCMNFLKEAHCDSKSDENSCCPFLHYIERRRDKVIQDDFEFKDFLQQQDKIVEKFMARMSLKQLKSKNDFYKTTVDPIGKQGLPSPSFLLGQCSQATMED